MQTVNTVPKEKFAFFTNLTQTLFWEILRFSSFVLTDLNNMEKVR
jgi:hypothetical protein